VNDLLFLILVCVVIIGYFPFIKKSPRRRFIWNRIKWSIYLVLSVPLLFSTFERLKQQFFCKI
jgi:EamA domain-containing membrane protein RarD